MGRSLLSGTDGPPNAATLIFRRPVPALDGHMSGCLESWRGDLRDTVLAMVSDFVRNRSALALRGTGVDIVSDVLIKFVDGGKCLRSTSMYLGWLCGADDDTAALRAAASFELLHAFALLQDDVMDGSALRRGRPSAHVQFATWHRARQLSGSPDRFGESAAVLLGDLCLVWAEQMLRESGVGGAALSRRGLDTTRCAPSSRSASSPTSSTMLAGSHRWMKCWMSRDESQVTTRCAGHWRSAPPGRV